MIKGPMTVEMGVEGHLHYCKVCDVNVECWLDCGADERALDGVLLAGGLICDDCVLAGKTEDDAR